MTAMKKTAEISECGQYRFSLTRMWDEERAILCFVMLNPSTADAELDDATIRRCIAFAKSWGFGAIEVVNLTPWRCPSPAGILAHWPSLDVMAQNKAAIDAATSRAGLTVYAWGGHEAGKHMRVNPPSWISPDGVALVINKDGSPRHPLYVRGDIVPVAWR